MHTYRTCTRTACRYEFSAGKNLLSGEYVLPSGVAIPFGAMISKLKREKLVGDLMQVGARARVAARGCIMIYVDGVRAARPTE